MSNRRENAMRAASVRVKLKTLFILVTLIVVWTLSEPSGYATQDADKSSQTEASQDEHHHDMSKMKDSGQTSMKTLMVMMGNEMGIRLGKSDNIIPMGRMGSGTSWLPQSTPMYMYHRETNGWLL